MGTRATVIRATVSPGIAEIFNDSVPSGARSAIIELSLLLTIGLLYNDGELLLEAGRRLGSAGLSVDAALERLGVGESKVPDSPGEGGH
jgi:hypothetical protein